MQQNTNINVDECYISITCCAYKLFTKILRHTIILLKTKTNNH